MLAQSQVVSTAVAPPASGEISTATLLDRLVDHRAKALIFRYEGRDVLPGYHVTEVKSGAFQALDCGANFESWHETFIQLWDVPPDDRRSFMPVATFLAIIGKVAAAVPFEPAAKLTFEVSDGTRAMQLYRASSVEVDADSVRVHLAQRPSSCKPRDRWFAENAAECCAAPPESAARCCN